jgi:alpha-1,6-mannosyltransferase
MNARTLPIGIRAAGLIVTMAIVAFAGSALVWAIAQRSAPGIQSGDQPIYLLGLSQPLPVVQLAGGWSVLIAVWAIMALLCVLGMLLAQTLTREGGAAPQSIIIALAVVGFALTFFSVQLSIDPYYYVAYGRLYGVFGINPYVLVAPLQVADGTLARLYVLLHNPPFGDPYGPGFTVFAGAIARLETGLDVRTQLWTWRVIALASAIVTALGISRMLRHSARQERGRRRAAYAFNPIVLFEAGVGGHNDLLMVAPAVWAFALVDEYPLVAGLLIGASIAVKYVAIIALPFLAIRAAKSSRMAGVLLSVLALAVPWLCARPFTFGAAAAHSAAAIGSSLMMSLNWLAALPFIRSGGAGVPIAPWMPVLPYLGVVTWPRAVQFALFALFAVVLIVSGVRYARNQSTGDLARPVAGLIWVMPALHPWYLTWIAPFAAGSGAWGIYAAWFAALGLLGYAHEGVVPSPGTDALLVIASIAMLAVPLAAARWLPRPAVEGLRPGRDVPIE